MKAAPSGEPPSVPPPSIPPAGRLLAAEYERARQSAELLRRSFRESGAPSLARLVRAVGCAVELMPLQHDEVALLAEMVSPGERSVSRKSAKTRAA
jgi:hypothetical protein